MLVEFVGSTGVGKSTLTEHLLRLLHAHGRRAVTSDQFVLRYCGLGLDRIRSRPLRSVLVDLVTLPWFLRFAARNWRLCWFMSVIVFRDIEPSWFRLNVCRNMAKQMGAYELLRTRASASDVVILDEGLLHQAHSLFVHPGRVPCPGELARFVREVPPPDLVVLVEGPKEEVVRRTVCRGHPRINGKRIVQAGVLVDRAQWVFRRVFELAAARADTAHVWNGERIRIEDELGGLVTRLTSVGVS